MKTLTLILTCLILASCEVEDIQPVEVIQPRPFVSHRDTSSFKTGRYNGTMHLQIPGHTDIVNPAYREIFTHQGNYVMRWWSAPDTTSLAPIADTLHYTMTHDVTNTSCGIQRFVYDYTVTTTRQYDSIFEQGTVRFRWYFNGTLQKDLPGEFTAKLKYVDKLTPHRGGWQP